MQHEELRASSSSPLAQFDSSTIRQYASQCSLQPSNKQLRSGSQTTYKTLLQRLVSRRLSRRSARPKRSADSNKPSPLLGPPRRSAACVHCRVNRRSPIESDNRRSPDPLAHTRAPTKHRTAKAKLPKRGQSYFN